MIMSSVQTCRPAHISLSLFPGAGRENPWMRSSPRRVTASRRATLLSMPRSS